ncbi:hypothetical protein [Empedobacter sp.]|uniref:hypothetical protein n=1 Tax=Empedobacter sp. TaxID=1927715 RepID=UPI0028A659BC|nr:hypothetical protein [Empedobacter sp.]
MKKRDNGRVGSKHKEESRQKISKAMLGNLNAELYTEDESLDLFCQMIVMSQDNSYTFIKQLTRQFGISYDVMINLIKRFPSLQEAYKLIKDNLETNCYTASNEDKLKIQLAMLNLKSNYGWTERVAQNTDITSGGQPLQMNNLITFISDVNEDEETDE